MLIDLSYFQNEVMVALTGRCVFEGVFYEKVHRFDVRMEHLVSGPDSDKVSCTFYVDLYTISLYVFHAQSSNQFNLCWYINMEIVKKKSHFVNRYSS